jgi:NAD(P)-dependent dehydrogenase (short-subunit alcohol dehydrogenase family)
MRKVCIVTGGAGGIGRCITEELLLAGYFVAVIDKDESKGDDLQRQHKSDDCLFFAGDIADPKVLESFVDTILQRHAQVDLLVNNACLSRGGLGRCGYDDFNYVLRVGVSAPYYLAHLLSSTFAQGASILNIASTRAFMSQPETESYSAAKGGIIALTHALAASLAGRVRVNAISPGWIDTSDSEWPLADRAQHPAGRVGTPKDIARLVLFLASEDASFITGENISVDGGMSHLMIYHNDHGWTYQPERT